MRQCLLSYVVQANTEGSPDRKERINCSIFIFIHKAAADVHDVSFSFKVAMTKTDWMLLVEQQHVGY